MRLVAALSLCRVLCTEAVFRYEFFRACATAIVRLNYIFRTNWNKASDTWCNY